MTQFLATPVDKSLGTTGSWQDIDLSGDVPVSATGAIFRVVNAGSLGKSYGLRKNGSTDDRYKDLRGYNQQYAIIGLDANRKCECKIEGTFLDFFLIGYTEEDATFFTNASDKSIATLTTWTDIDLSSDIAVGSVAAIFEVVNGNIAYRNFGLRKNGSTDNRHTDAFGKTHSFIIVGVDANRKCEGYIESSDVDFYLLGYLNRGQAETNAIDKSLGSTGSYVDIDESANAPSDVTGIFGELISTDDYKYATRKNGTSFDYYEDSNRHDSLMAGVDANKKWEGKIENTNVDFFTLGYFVPGYVALSGATNAVSSITGKLGIQWGMAGVVPVSSSVTGLLGLHIPIAGTITTTSSLSGDLSKTKALKGSINVVSTIEGDLTCTWLLAGSTDVATNVTGKLSTQWSLLGEIPGSSSVTGSLGVEIQLLASTNFGISNYAGPTGAFIAYGDPTDFRVFITSTADPTANVGETYIGSANPNSLIVYNSGHGRSEFRWAIPNAPYDKGDLTFAGLCGQTVTHTKGDTDYIPCIIPSANGNGAIGEWWVTDIANTSFVVRNSGSGLTAFKWAIPRFETGGKGASSFAGSDGVLITHNLNISGGYTPLIIPTDNPNGHLGAVYVTDITANSFTVKNTGSAITTFMWLISDTTRGIAAYSDVFGVLSRAVPIAGPINSLSTTSGTLSITKYIAGIIAGNSQLTGALIFVAPTQGFYYSKLGTDNFINPPDEDFNVTIEHNGIASFDFVIQNNAANRTIIADHLTEDFKIMRDDGTEILTGSIDSDRIEYFAVGEGGAGKRIRLSGYASFIDLAYLIYKRMADTDAEAVGSVQDEDNSTATFTDYTTQANNDTINDVLPTFGAVNDALYAGKDETFFAAKIKYSTKGIHAANTTVVIEYSKGSGVWATLDCIDESYAFTEDAGTYPLYMPNKPDDWAKDTINGKNQYHIRFRITQGSYSTLPKLDRIWLSNADVCRVQFNEVAANTILGYVLEGTEYSEDATDQCPADIVTIRGEYDSKLRWIFGLGSALTWEDSNGDKQRYDVWIDTSNKTHFKQQRGTDKGDLSGDFRTVNNKMGYHGIGTRIFGAGGYDGINQKRAIVEDLSAQGTHKLREIILEDSRITGYEALKEETQKSLTIHKAPLKEVSGDIDTKDWLNKSLSVGDKITINQPDWNLNDQELYIMRAVIDPSNTHLDLGTSQMHLEHMRSSLQRQMDINNVWMHGAVSTYISGPVEDNYQRVDASTVYPVEMKIEIPSNARAINRVEISWTLSNYKSSVKPSSSSGGGHYHSHGASGGGGGHNHGGSSDLDGGHLHVIGNSGLEGGHIHAIGSGGGHDHIVTGDTGACSYDVDAIYGLNPGTLCDNGYCVEGWYAHKAAGPNHVHITVGTTVYEYGHAHTESTEPNHIHTVPNSDTEPDHWHVVGTDTEPNHAHSVPDSNTEPDHEHTTDYGVHEEAGGTTLELYVDDVLVADTYVGNQTNINITGWVSTGSNTVKLQPVVGDNKKGRAEISSINTVFLENLK